MILKCKVCGKDLQYCGYENNEVAYCESCKYKESMVIDMDMEKFREAHMKLREGFAYGECGGCQFRLQSLCNGLEKTDYCRLYCDGGYTCTPTYEWLQHCKEVKDDGIEPYNKNDISKTDFTLKEKV